MPATRQRPGPATAAWLALLVAAIWVAVPAAVAAHADLDTALPPDGAILASPPSEIVLTFTEALDARRSSLTLHAAGGAEIARAGVDPGNELTMRIDPPVLEPGGYEIRSTAVAAHDGAIKRETLTFTITEPAAAPTAARTASPTASSSTTELPSTAPTADPSPAPAADDSSAAGTAGVLVPILAAIALVIALGAWLVRSRARSAG